MKRKVLFLVPVVLGAVVWFVALVLWMPGRSHAGPPERMNAHQQEIQAQLVAHVTKLAGDIGERNTPKSLATAIAYIESELRRDQLVVTEQHYTALGGNFTNIEGELKGSEHPEQIIIVCGHYDSVQGSPGANDNGSGAAAVLELARQFGQAKVKPKSTIRFVLFGTEEPPYFGTEGMGSYSYAARCQAQRQNIAAVVVLETLGYYTDAPRTQEYPPLLRNFLPDTGNFIAFVANPASRQLLERCVGEFRATTGFPSEGVAPPDAVPGVDWSDQLYFWKFGYPAVMVTDTAPYRYPHYHKLTDTPDKLNYPAFARVVGGIQKVVAKLANS